jgi:hypothetical protein
MKRIICLRGIAVGIGLLFLSAPILAGSEPTEEMGILDPEELAPELAEETPFWRDPDRWSFQVGVAFITDSTINDISMGDVGLASGDAGGEIYLLQASLKLASFEPELFGSRVELDLELPAVLGFVDEREAISFSSTMRV